MSGQEPQSENDLLAEIGLPVDRIDPNNLFDLLGVPEDCEDDPLINKRGRERVKALRKWEQYRANPAVQKMATALMARISDAQRRLRKPEGRTDYRKELQKRRGDEFRDYVRPTIVPGERLSEDRIRQLLAKAGTFKISEQAARQVIEELSHVENPFAVLGLMPVVEDESWPTAFDILMFEESEVPPVGVDNRVAVQIRKIECALQANKIDDDEANRLTTYVEEARRTLGNSEIVKLYYRSILKTRVDRFAETARLTLKSGRRDTGTLIRLVHLGRKMRLGQQHIEKIIAKVTGVRMETILGGGEPSLQVSRARIDAFVTGDGSGSIETLSVRNVGTGTLEVTVEPSHSWIKVSDNHFKTQTRQDLTVTLPPSRLLPGEPLSGTITIDSNGGRADVEITAVLGQPGPGLNAEDYRIAGGYYKYMGFLWWTFLPLVTLPWKFMMNRKKCTFLAFHALQSLALLFWNIVVLVLFSLLSAIYKPEEAPCSAALISLLVLFNIFGLPFLVCRVVRRERNLQLPGIAVLLKRLL
jgi:uncharacterized membrane protein